MPSKRKKSKPIKHSAVGARLEKAGLLPRGYSKSLTENKKDRIRKVYNKFMGAGKYPESFVTKSVSLASAKILREAGYPVKFSKHGRGKKPVVSFATHGARSVDYVTGKVVRAYGPKGKGYRSLTPVRTKGKTLHERAAEFFATRRPGQYLFMAHGPDAVFGTRIASMAAFEKYMKNLQKRFHGTPREFEQFKDDLYIVEYEGGDPDQDLEAA